VGPESVRERNRSAQGALTCHHDTRPEQPSLDGRRIVVFDVNETLLDMKVLA